MSTPKLDGLPVTRQSVATAGTGVRLIAAIATAANRMADLP
jgi:hypothetical protein